MLRITTVTLDDRAAAEAEALHGAFLMDAVVTFRGERVRVLREHVERTEHGLEWVFELEAQED